MEIRRIATEDLVCRPTTYVDALGLMSGFDYLIGRPTILFGPKGTGKTLSAYAWAHEHNWLLLEFAGVWTFVMMPLLSRTTFVAQSSTVPSGSPSVITWSRPCPTSSKYAVT